MTREQTILAMIEGREQEAEHKAQWIAEWVGANQPKTLGEFQAIDPTSMLGEISPDEAREYVQAIHQLMSIGNPAPMIALMRKVFDSGLQCMAEGAWSDYSAGCEDSMASDQFDKYRERRGLS